MDAKNSSENWARKALLLMDEVDPLIRFGCVSAEAELHKPAAKAFWEVCHMLASVAEQIDSACEALPVSPTGEQLYLMVTRRFKSGSFPWATVAESRKAAWSAVAADLQFSPDNILARYSQPTPE